MRRPVTHAFLALLAGIAAISVGCAQSDPVSDADEAYKQGHALAEQGRPESAIPYYDSALQLNPKFVAAYNERGTARRIRGDVAGSMSDFNRAIELDPHFAEALCNRGLNHLAENDLPKALEDLNAAIVANPKLAEAYTTRGMVHTRRSEIQDAIADFAKAIELSPECASAYANRADARAASNDLDGAYSDFTKAIELGEKHPEKNGAATVATAYNNRGKVEQDRNHATEARLDYNKAIERDPKFAEAYLNRGVLRKMSGDSDELKGALADCNKAIELKPQFAEAYRFRGEIKLALKEPRGAIDDLEQAAKLAPDSPQVHNSLGQAYVSQRDKRAMAEFDKAITLDSHMVEAYSSRAIYKGLQQDFSAAIADFSQGIEILGGVDSLKNPTAADGQSPAVNPKLLGLLFNRGVYRRIWGDSLNRSSLVARQKRDPRADELQKSAKEQFSLALVDFNKVAAADANAKTVPLIYEHRGEVRRALGDTKQAIEDFNRQLQLKPDSSSALNSRALAHQDEGDDPAALADFNKAIEANRDNAEAYANRGLLLLRLKQELRARQDFEACRQLKPELGPQLDILIQNVLARNQDQAKDDKR